MIAMQRDEPDYSLVGLLRVIPSVRYHKYHVPPPAIPFLARYFGARHHQWRLPRVISRSKDRVPMGSSAQRLHSCLLRRFCRLAFIPFSRFAQCADGPWRRPDLAITDPDIRVQLWSVCAA